MKFILSLCSAMVVSVSGCSIAGMSRAISDFSKDPEPSIYISIVDSIEQALSISINGDNLHSHQIQIARRDGIIDPVAQSSLYASANSGLCSPTQTRDDWANMRCSIVNTIDSAKAPCKSDARCVSFRLAPFVAHDEELMSVVAAAASNPCRFVPDPDALKRRHHSRDPRGPATMHSAEASRYWLSCASTHKITGEIEPGANEGEYAIRWRKSAT